MACECRNARVSLIASLAAVLSGCWTPPSAYVQPGGEPRLIENGIEVEWAVHSAKVESVDRAARTVALSVRGRRLSPYDVGRDVSNWDEIRVGDQVSATIKEVLTVYVGPADESVVQAPLPDARVRVVDPSYRLLTVEFPDGGTATFKTGLRTRMKGIEAGDFVAIRPIEAVELRVRHHVGRVAG